MSLETIETKTQVARKFSAILQEWLEADEIKEMVATKNSANDYCDANMAMHEAFTSVIGREPDLDDMARRDMQSPDLALFNGAWEIAENHGYFVNEANQ